MLPDRLQTALSLALGMVFLIGLIGEAYGYRDCPHHAVSRTAVHGPEVTSELAVHGSANSASADRGTATSDPLEEPVEGPCLCVGSCHAVPTAPGLADPPRLPPMDHLVHRFRAPAPDSRVQRPHPYRLPFANGPPAVSL